MKVRKTTERKNSKIAGGISTVMVEEDNTI
jgi:hypothetical protein